METMTAEITYQVGTYYQEADLLHTWTIADGDGQIISELYVDMETFEIRNVWTHADHRGAGLATALYRAALAMFPIRHATTAHRTDEGSRWASIVGGDTAPCSDGCCDTEE